MFINHLTVAYMRTHSRQIWLDWISQSCLYSWWVAQSGLGTAWSHIGGKVTLNKLKLRRWAADAYGRLEYESKGYLIFEMIQAMAFSDSLLHILDFFFPLRLIYSRGQVCLLSAINVKEKFNHNTLSWGDRLTFISNRYTTVLPSFCPHDNSLDSIFHNSKSLRTICLMANLSNEPGLR